MDKYEKRLKKLQKFNEFDKEDYHIERDEIYEKFINDISNGEIKNIKDAKKIANLIKEKSIDIDRDIWFS